MSNCSSLPKHPERYQLGAANAIKDFAPNDAPRLARLITVATPAQFDILYPLVEGNRDAQQHIGRLIGQSPPDSLGALERVEFGKRRAGAAITKLRLGGREEIFDALRVDDDPEALTQFVHRCRERHVSISELVECLYKADALRQAEHGAEGKIDNEVLFGLLLALGDFQAEDIRDDTSRERLVEHLVAWYAKDNSSAIHGATGWLLRHWDTATGLKKSTEHQLSIPGSRMVYLGIEAINKG